MAGATLENGGFTHCFVLGVVSTGWSGPGSLRAMGIQALLGAVNVSRITHGGKEFLAVRLRMRMRTTCEVRVGGEKKWPVELTSFGMEYGLAVHCATEVWQGESIW